MKQKIRIILRISAIAGILFLFLDCAGKKRSWNFNDIYSLDVRILETGEWLEITKKELEDLDKIMKPQLKYYLKKDFRVYEKLSPHYENILITFNIIDTLNSEISSLADQMKNNPADSLDSVPDDTTLSYRDMINFKKKKIKKNQAKFFKSIEKLKKGFKSEKKLLVFILEETLPLKNKLYDLKYKRELINPEIQLLNKKLDEAIFINPNSSYSKKILKVSKTVESYLIKLDKYENFLYKIDRFAKKEAGGYVILISKKSDSMRYVDRYEKGMEEYLSILTKIRKISESI